MILMLSWLLQYYHNSHSNKQDVTLQGNAIQSKALSDALIDGCP